MAPQDRFVYIKQFESPVLQQENLKNMKAGQGLDFDT